MVKSIKVNALLNTIRQSLTILFPLITFPYVSRILGSYEFGRYTFSTSIVSYFQLFAAFGISTYAIREGAEIREDKEATTRLANELFTMGTITTVIAFAALALIVFFNKKVSSYSSLIFIHSLCMIMTMLGLDWVNNIYEDFLYITIRYIVVQLIALVCIFLFVHDSSDVNIYCLIIVCGSYGGNLVNLFYVRRYIGTPKLVKMPIKKYSGLLFLEDCLSLRQLV